MATTLRRLSSLLLTSSFSPSEDPARAVLQARADHFSNLVTWSTVIVAIGVALEGVEIVHDVIAWIKQKRREKREITALKEVAKIFPSGETRGKAESHSDHPRWVKRVLRAGLIAVVIGVVGEWRYGARLEDSHNAIHKYDVAKLTAAEQKAGDAAISAQIAKDASKVAKRESSDSFIIARGAREEADSFEKDIKAAKTQAALAESHLAEAQRQTAAATEELNRLKSPRSLTHIPELIAALESFEGTEYTFSGVFGDEESGNLVRAIDDVLRRSRWKKVKPVHRFPMLTFSDKGGDFEVPSILSTGIQVSVDSTESADTLNALPKEQLPPLIRAAMELNAGLFSSLFPPQETGSKMVDVQNGTSMTVRISVGKKP